MSALPLVSVGLPVRNGMPHLPLAIAALLDQDYPHIEIVISDNHSDDGTSDYCRGLAESNPKVRYACNPRDLGLLENFRLAFEQSRGKFFMWAAHDDQWNSGYVTALVETHLRAAGESEAVCRAPIASRSQTVLATPMVIHVDQNGSIEAEPCDRPASGESSRANIEQLFADHAAGWIHGLWRADWLAGHLREFLAYPLWGGDIMWLADICLRYRVVGSRAAVLYKQRRKSAYAPRNARQAVAFWALLCWHLSKTAVRHAEGRTRAELLLLCWQYVYRTCIRRPNRTRTAWRVIRMILIAASTCVSLAAGQAIARTYRRFLPARAG